MGDEMTHSIMTQTQPDIHYALDREDIHQLASSLDDVLDFINAAGARIIMYRMTNPPPAAGQIARLILAQCQELAEGCVAPAEERRHAGALRGDQPAGE